MIENRFHFFIIFYKSFKDLINSNSYSNFLFNMPKLSAFLVSYLMYNWFFSWWKRLFYIRIFLDFLRKNGKNATATLLTFCTICISIFSSCWSSLHYLIYLVLNINYRGSFHKMNLYYYNPWNCFKILPIISRNNIKLHVFARNYHIVVLASMLNEIFD